jgi:hypothetical protein
MAVPHNSIMDPNALSNSIKGEMQGLFYPQLHDTCIGGSAGPPAHSGWYTLNQAEDICLTLGYVTGKNSDESCAGYWYDSKSSMYCRKYNDYLYKFFFYWHFDPVSNGKCDTGPKGNAFLGSPISQPMAIQVAYHVYPGKKHPQDDNSNGDTGDDDVDCNEAFKDCMGNAECQGFTFTCADATSGCGKCNPRDRYCDQKYPPKNSKIYYSTYQYKNGRGLSIDATHAAWVKVRQIHSTKSNATSLMV